MEACAENNVPLIILDRPNPNGDYIDGPILEERYKSFVGMHPIPIVHGMTVGELALMINGEGWLHNIKKCELTVIKVANYDHNHQYSLPIKPSPNLPNDLSVRLYPSLGFFEGTSVSVGRGTDFPFQMLGYPNKNMGIPLTKAKKIRGSWSELNHAGSVLYGERLFQDKYKSGIDLNYLYRWNKKFQAENIELFSRANFMDKLSGTSSIRKLIMSGANADEIKRTWQVGLTKFQKMRSRYLLYPDSDEITILYK